MKKEEIPVYANSSLNLRTLTLKSKLKFGADKDLTVQEFLNLKRHKDLIEMYYRLGMINFNTEVLNILKIYNIDKIPKPGKLNNEEARKKIYEVFGRHINPENKNLIIKIANRTRKKILAAHISSKKRDNIKFSKAALTRRNHGH